MPFAKQLKVLVADDTSTSRMLLNGALNEIGVTSIAFAKDGTEALQSMKASPCHLVLSDYNMPGLDGLQLLKALREFPTTSRVGFILVTGRGDAALINEGKKFGLNNFLPKPFTNTSLKGCIEAVVGKLV